MSTLLDAALSYAGRGWLVFPVYEAVPNASCSCSEGATCKNVGKHPRTPNGFKDATADPDQIVAWWTESPNASIANPPGESDVVIDIDPRAGGDRTFEGLVRRLGPLPPTTRTLTGGGGEHYRFRVPPGLRLPKQLGPGVDLKGCGGGYVLLPPSPHASGKPYAWAAYGDPEEQAVAGLPSPWLIEIKRISAAESGAAAQLPDKIIEGQGRNNYLASLAGSLRRRGANEAEIREALHLFNKIRCEPPLDQRELARIAKSISRYEPSAPESHESAESTSEPARGVIETAVLLDMIASRIRRYVVLTEPQACVLALWVLHTYAIETAESTPYLSITSAEKRSGKTRLLEILEHLVFNPWLTGRATPAVLVRKIEATHPTLLLDESDAAFNGNKEYAEALRGVLNAGHRRGGRCSLCIGQGANITFKDFDVFGPKAIAGIGTLPDTVADRSIPIRLRRKGGREQVDRFRTRDVETESFELRTRLERWAANALPALSRARPALPELLSDRAADGAEPLLAIADHAGADWPRLARAAIVELFAEKSAEDSSVGVRLLGDIRTVMETNGIDRITSADLCAELHRIEGSPWSEYGRQAKPISPSKVAELLKGYEIRPGTIRIGPGPKDSAKGYYRESFTDSWERYLPLAPKDGLRNVTPSQINEGAGSPAYSPVTERSRDGSERVRICLRSQPPPDLAPAGVEQGEEVQPAPTSHDHLVTAGMLEIVNSGGPSDGVTALALDSRATGGGSCARFIGLDLRKPCADCGADYRCHVFRWPSGRSQGEKAVLPDPTLAESSEAIKATRNASSEVA